MVLSSDACSETLSTCTQLFRESFHFSEEWKAGLTRNLKFAFGIRLHHRTIAKIPINYHIDNFVGITEVILLCQLFTHRVTLSSGCIQHSSLMRGFSVVFICFTAKQTEVKHL